MQMKQFRNRKNISLWAVKSYVIIMGKIHQSTQFGFTFTNTHVKKQEQCRLSSQAKEEMKGGSEMGKQSDRAGKFIGPRKVEQKFDKQNNNKPPCGMDLDESMDGWEKKSETKPAKNKKKRK